MSLNVNFTGDIGLFRAFEKSDIDPFNDTELPGSDLNIGNFEFIIHDNRPAFFYDVQSHYSCGYAFLQKLNVGRFAGLGLANNHCLDYGPDGITDTLTVLKEQGVQTFGYGNDSGYHVGLFERKGIRLCIIACVKQGRWSRDKHGFGPDPYDAGAIIEEIRIRENTCDHVIVYPHWGTELVEIPDGQDVINARKFIEAGLQQSLVIIRILPRELRDTGMDLLLTAWGVLFISRKKSWVIAIKTKTERYLLC